MIQAIPHTLWLHWGQTDLFIGYNLNNSNGQTDILRNGPKAVRLMDAEKTNVKRLLITRLDTFRFWNLTDEEVLRLFRDEIMGNPDSPIDEVNLGRINFSLSRATNYLNNKWYPIPRGIPVHFKKEEEIIAWIRGQRKTKDGYVNRNLCRYLQVVNAYHTLLSAPWVTIEDGKIDVRDKALMGKIIWIFNGREFRYEDDSKKFWRESSEASWNYVTDTGWNWNILFYARFRLKDEERAVQKFIQSPEYDVKALVNDLHGVRAEVADPAHAFKLMEYILSKMRLDPRNMEIKNRDMCSNDEWERWKEKQFFGWQFTALIEKKAKFWTQTKAISAKRRELKFSCKSPSIEVQFVLVWNNNESAYAHHAIYQCVSDIFEKIRLDGYCNAEDIRHFMWLNITEDIRQEIWLTDEHILSYILTKLIPIRFPENRRKQTQYTTMSSVVRLAMNDLADMGECILEFPPHTKKNDARSLYGIYAWKKIAVKNITFTSELLRLVDEEKDESWILREEEVTIPFSEQSKLEISSQPPRPDQQFVIPRSVHESLAKILDGVNRPKSSR